MSGLAWGVNQQASTSLRLPNDFITQHCPEVAQNGEKYQFAVQVVLLPPYASDSTPETPAQQVLDQQGAFVKRVEETSTGSLPKTTSRTCVYGLKKVLPSHVLQEKWWCRGFRKLGPFRLQILLSPELPPDEAQKKENQCARSKETRQITKALMQQVNSSITDQQLQQLQLSEQQQCQQQSMQAPTASVLQETSAGPCRTVSTAATGARNNQQLAYNAAQPAPAAAVSVQPAHARKPASAPKALGRPPAAATAASAAGAAAAGLAAELEDDGLVERIASNTVPAPGRAGAQAAIAAAAEKPAAPAGQQRPKQHQSAARSFVVATAGHAEQQGPKGKSAKQQGRAQKGGPGAATGQKELVPRQGSGNQPVLDRQGSGTLPLHSQQQQPRCNSSDGQDRAQAKQQQQSGSDKHAPPQAQQARGQQVRGQQQGLQRQGSGGGAGQQGQAQQQGLQRKGSAMRTPAQAQQQQQQQQGLQRQHSGERAVPKVLQNLQRQGSAPGSLPQPALAVKRPLANSPGIAKKQGPLAKKAAPFNLMAVLDDISKGVVSPLTSPAEQQEHQEQDTAEAMQWEQQGGCFEGSADVEMRLPSSLKRQLQNRQQQAERLQQQQQPSQRLPLVSSPQDPRLGQKQCMQQPQQQQRQGAATGQLPRSVPAAHAQQQQGSAAAHPPRALPAGASQQQHQQQVRSQAQQRQGGVTARSPPASAAEVGIAQQQQQQQEQEQAVVPQMKQEEQCKVQLQEQGGVEEPPLAFSPAEPVTNPAQQQQQQACEGQRTPSDPLPDLRSAQPESQPLCKTEWEQSGPQERVQHLKELQSWGQPAQHCRPGSGSGAGSCSLGRTSSTRVNAPLRTGPSGFRGPVQWKRFCGRGTDLDQRRQQQQQWRRQSVDSVEQDARAPLSNLDADCEVDSPRVGEERTNAGNRGCGKGQGSRGAEAGQPARQRSRSPVAGQRMSGDAGEAGRGAAAAAAGTSKKQRQQQGLCANNAAGQPAAATAAGAGRRQPPALSGSNSLSLLITEGMDTLKFQLVALQASVPGLKLQQGRIRQLQVVFVEQTAPGDGAAEGVRVLAGPCQAPTSLAAGGIVGFFGQPLKVTLASQQLRGRTIIGCCPASSILPDTGSTGGVLSIAFIVQPVAVAAAGSGRAAGAVAADAGAVCQQQQQQQQQQQHDDMDIDKQDETASASADVQKAAAMAAPTTELPVETPQQLEQIQGQPAMAQATTSAAFQQQAYSAAHQQQPYSAAFQQQAEEQLQLGTDAVMTDAHTPYIKPDPDSVTCQDSAAAAAEAPGVPIKQEPQEALASTLGCKKQTSPPGLEQGTASAAIAAAAAALRKRRRKDTCSQPGRTSFAVHPSAASAQPARSAPAAAVEGCGLAAPAAAAPAAAAVPRFDPVEKDSADTPQPPSGPFIERFAAANPAAARTLTAAAFAAPPTDPAAFCPAAAVTVAAFAAGTIRSAGLATGLLAETLQPLQVAQHPSPIITDNVGLARQLIQPIPQYPDLTSATVPRVAPVATSIVKQEAAPCGLPPTPIAAADTAATPIAAAGAAATPITAAGTAGTAGTVAIKQEPAVQGGLPASPSTPSAALAEATGSIAPLAGGLQGPAGLPRCDCSIPVAVVAAGGGQDAATAAAATAGDADGATATVVVPGGQPTLRPAGSTSSAAEGPGAHAARGLGCTLPAAATATAVGGAAGSAADLPDAALNPAQPRSPTVPPEGQVGRLVPSPASSLGGVAAPPVVDVGAPGTLIALGSGISSSTETLCMPALPAVSVSGSNRFEISDAVVQAVMDLVMFLHKHQDPTLDFLGCIEALQDLREQPDAAARFMRMGYAALTSAVRMNNAAAAVKVVQRYLQK